MLLDDDGAECVGDFLEHLPQAEGRVLEFELVGFDLREVEDVVEDAQQVPGRRVRDVDELVRLGREVGLQRKAGHVENRVHRRADLVTHVGEEHRLGLGRLLRLGLGELQRSLLFLALGDVADRHGDLHAFGPAGGQRTQADLDRELRAVLAQAAKLAVGAHRTGRRRLMERSRAARHAADARPAARAFPRAGQ